MVNDDNDPPEYVDICISFIHLSLILAVKPLCEVQVNLRALPSDAFERVTGSDGVFYSITYDLAIKVGPMLEFQMLYKGQEYGKAVARYT
jgi:hypothetical protein